jgi:hypothetical protein
MFEKKKELVQPKALNEFEFSKTKGFGAYNYGEVATKTVAGETSLTIERIGKVFFFKSKPKNDTVDYHSIEKIEIKTNFSSGDLVSGIIIATISICTLQIYGLLLTALLIFCAYGKQIVITRKDSSRIFILIGKFQQEETDRLIKLLGEKTGKKVA